MLKNYVFSERPFLQNNLEDRTNRFTQKRHDKRRKMKKKIEKIV